MPGTEVIRYKLSVLSAGILPLLPISKTYTTFQIEILHYTPSKQSKARSYGRDCAAQNMQIEE
jgi:hypothetical protein